MEQAFVAAHEHKYSVPLRYLVLKKPTTDDVCMAGALYGSIALLLVHSATAFTSSKFVDDAHQGSIFIGVLFSTCGTAYMYRVPVIILLTVPLKALAQSEMSAELS